MTEPSNPARSEHEEDLLRLQKILRYDQGFQLILALYNDPPAYRNSLIEHLNRRFERPAILNVRTLPDFSAFEDRLQTVAQEADLIHVTGLDAWLLGEACNPRLQSFNQRRESIAQNCAKSLILWLPGYLAQDFATQAPDCWEWRRAVLDFCYLPEADLETDVFNTALYNSALLDRLEPIAQVFEPIEQYPSQEWSHARFLMQYDQIENHLKAGQIQIAYQQAEALLNQALHAGTKAYQNADFDIAVAYYLFGEASRIKGLVEAGLASLKQAEQKLQAVANTGNPSAASMLFKILIEQGDCLMDLGQLDKAAEIFQYVIELDKKRHSFRNVAVCKERLASINRLNKNYATAIALYMEAQKVFKQLNEPQSTAAIWHQMGMIYKETQEFKLAEHAYKKALKINKNMANKSYEAASLGELGNLFDKLGQLEKSILFYKKAIEIYNKLGDKLYEGMVRSNLAGRLIQLQRYEEARKELELAIESNKTFGHCTKPWKMLSLLFDLEQATNDPSAAHAAKQQAIQSFLAYRRDGGENLDKPELAKLCQSVLFAIREGNTEDILKALETQPDALKQVTPKLRAILKGERNPSLADAPELDYIEAAELILLLENLS